ncbi:zeta-carotene desaturase [Vigna unguiculata]|uniref:Zeta-carotene desaturase n=1 Tax=Vigna unguiculata TaxID=3917 RepID=A0A4D6LHP4_VIGUN|nr:zeta-carotene desaturase [Vigna unguiculata]
MNRKKAFAEGKLKSMGYSSSFLAFLLLALLLNVTNGRPLVPALFIFGDSVVDVGNNNHKLTVIKANFPPYGRDFENHYPTGRFCNGKLATDFTADLLGFTSYPPAYLNLNTKGNNLLNGANFASAASGYYEPTAKLYNAIPLSQQLQYYKECQNKLVEAAGQSNASSIITDAIYLSLHALGARRIGVTSLPPIGCLPGAITLFGFSSNECVASLNSDAISFNEKLNTTSNNLQNMLPGLNLVIFDIYQPLYDLVTKPSENGFFEARKACCGTGLIETSILCNRKSIGTCANASEYVFWDSFHPSEAANKLLADSLIAAGISLIS